MAIQEQRLEEDRILGKFVGRILSVCPALRILPFGSRAEGNAREDSDYDLLVVVPDDCDLKRAATAIEESLAGLGVAKDVVVAPERRFARYRGVVNTVYWRASKAGRTLYERAE